MKTRRPRNYDKQITRWASMGYTSCIMFGKTWPLRKGLYYRVCFDRARPSASVIQEFSFGN